MDTQFYPNGKYNINRFLLCYFYVPFTNKNVTRMFFYVFSSDAFCCSPGEPIDGSFFVRELASQAQMSEAAMNAVGCRQQQRGY